MTEYYILAEDGRTPVPVDLFAWGSWFEANREKKIVAQTHGRTTTISKRGHSRREKVMVSTVFLGLNHRWGPGEPLLWESMTFNESKKCTIDMTKYGGKKYRTDTSEWQHPNTEIETGMRRYTSYEDAVKGHAEICAALGLTYPDPLPPVPPVPKAARRITAKLRIKPKTKTP